MRLALDGTNSPSLRLSLSFPYPIARGESPSPISFLQSPPSSYSLSEDSASAGSLPRGLGSLLEAPRI